MSENPYATGPAAPHAQETPTNKAPIGMIIISILVIILGLFGSLFVFLTFLQQLMPAQVAQDLESIEDPQMRMQQIMIGLGETTKIWTLLFAGINLFIAPLLVIGGIGCLAKKRWGWSILTKVTVAAAAFVLVRGITNIFIFVLPFMALLEEKAGDPDIEQAVPILRVVMIGLMGFIILCMIIFYLWSHLYLKRDRVRVYLGVDQADPFQGMREFPR